MNKLNTNPLRCMKLPQDKSKEFNHSDEEFDEVLEDGLRLNDMVQQLKKQVAVQEQDNLALIERNGELEAENSKLKSMTVSEAKDKAKKVIRDLQVIRDGYSIGTDGRNVAQQAINLVMKQFDIGTFEVACKFKAEAEDTVNEPQHYKQHAMECIDEMLQVFGVKAVKSYCRCNAWKYRYRAPYKGKFEEDNAKADWYLKKLSELDAASIFENEPDND